MTTPGRKFEAVSGSGYRYSINGQEKEKDLNENITTALYWEYDSRIGRRWNADPVTKEFESSYACFSNNPVFLTDIEGLSSDPPKKKVNVILVFDPDEAAHMKDTKGSNWVIIQMATLKSGLKQLKDYLDKNDVELASLALVHHGNEYGHGNNMESESPVTLGKESLSKLNNIVKELIKNNNGTRPANFEEEFKKGVLQKFQFSNAQLDTYLNLSDILSLCSEGSNYFSIACDEAKENDKDIGAELSFMGGGKINVYTNTNFSVINKQISLRYKGYSPEKILFGSILNSRLTRARHFC
jgi:hypothetical protein